MIKIGTHDGCFHTDEVSACWLLKGLPEYKDAIIIRSRDQAVLDDCDIVVDVGSEFDVLNKRFDHHMRTFKEVFDSDHSYTLLSSCGLIWKYYGRKILRDTYQVKEHFIEPLYVILYEMFIESIDCNDVGVTHCACDELKYVLPRFPLVQCVADSSKGYSNTLDDFKHAMTHSERILGKQMRYLTREYESLVNEYTNGKLIELISGITIVDLSNSRFPATYFHVMTNRPEVSGAIVRNAINGLLTIEPLYKKGISIEHCFRAKMELYSMHESDTVDNLIRLCNV